MRFDHKCARVVALALALFGTAAVANPPAQRAKLPGDSIYQLDLHLVDQGGKAFELRSLRGEPVLIAMFYTSCKFACPLIIEQVKRTERALGATDGKGLHVLLVSFDPARDTPAALMAAGEEHHVDFSHWTLARTEPAGVRKFAAILGVQYRAMLNGDFSHSSIVTLVDRDGRIAARSDHIDNPDAELVAAAARVLHEVHAEP